MASASDLRLGSTLTAIALALFLPVLLVGPTACDDDGEEHPMDTTTGCVEGQVNQGVITFPGGLPASSGNLRVDDLRGSVNPATGEADFSGAVTNTGSGSGDNFESIDVSVVSGGSVTSEIAIDDISSGNSSAINFDLECMSGHQVTFVIESTEEDGDVNSVCFTFTCP